MVLDYHQSVDLFPFCPFIPLGYSLSADLSRKENIFPLCELCVSSEAPLYGTSPDQRDRRAVKNILSPIRIAGHLKAIIRIKMWCCRKACSYCFPSSQRKTIKKVNSATFALSARDKWTLLGSPLSLPFLRANYKKGTPLLGVVVNLKF